MNRGLSVPEAYMDGDLLIENGTLYDFIELAAQNYTGVRSYPLINVLQMIGIGSKKLKQYNPVGVAQQNVAHHYDLSDELYDLFLDRDRQYSCAYYVHPDDDLETAQLNKKRHLASKLLLDGGDLNVLDIGSGWGGLGMYLARVSGRKCYRCHVVYRTAQSVKRTRPCRWTSGPGKVSLTRLPRSSTEIRPDRLRGHVRARGQEKLHGIL